LVVTRRLKEIVDKVEFFSMDVEDEVVSKELKERLVKANAPKDIGVKAAHGDGVAEPLNGQGILVLDLSLQIGLVPVVPDSWSSNVEPVLANLEQRRDLRLLCV